MEEKYDSGKKIALFFDYAVEAGIDAEKLQIRDSGLFRKNAGRCVGLCRKTLDVLAAHGDATFYIQTTMNFLEEQLAQQAKESNS